MRNIQNRPDYDLLAKKIRIHTVNMVHRARSSHIGSCFSVAEILAVLYGSILNIDPSQPDMPERDRFILSKGHAAAILYAVLAERGFFSLEWLDTFYLDGSQLPGHATKGVPGVEVSAGSLGHGLPIGCGMALAAKRDGASSRVFVLLSDGECDEGSVWEAALFAPYHHLDNLIAIIDYNKIQCYGRVEEVLDLNPLPDKWESFGWAVRRIDGHSPEKIEEALSGVPFESGKPSCIVADTVKGKGISFLEDTLESHYKVLNEEERDRALNELGASN